MVSISNVILLETILSNTSLGMVWINVQAFKVNGSSFTVGH